jgi:hypothetical protein
MNQSPHLDEADRAEATSIEAATGDQVRARLQPYLEDLREVAPAAWHFLAGRPEHQAAGADWIAAFNEVTRFGWRGRRLPAPRNAEIVKVVAELGDLEAAAYRAHHQIGLK